MKHLYILLFMLATIASCSSDDNNDLQEDYTSVTILIESESYGALIEPVLATMTDDSTFKKVANMDEYIVFNHTSNEYKLFNPSILSVYLFFDFYEGAYASNRFLNPIQITPFTKNHVVINSMDYTINDLDKTDPTKYPLN